MTVIQISGCSDDLIEVDGEIAGADEYSTSTGHWQAVIEAPNGETMMVYVDYRDNGCWTVSHGLFEEGFELPDWPVSVIACADTSYSTALVLDVPDGSKLTASESHD